MFDKFGEMGSAEQINKLAVNLLNEGSAKELRELAIENGIDPEMADAFLEGDIPVLCDPMTAAMGKIDVEMQQFKPKTEMLEDWGDLIKMMAADDEAFAINVRKKGKSLVTLFGEIMIHEMKNPVELDKNIVKAAGLEVNYPIKLAQAGTRTIRRLIRDYYTR